MSQEPLQSNKQNFPNFYRTVPSEKALYAAIIALLKHFGWMWVGIIYADDDSSINAIKIIKNMIVESGGCVEFIKLVPSINDYTPERIKDIEQTIARSTANVILLYGSKNNVYYLELNVHVTSIPGKVWIHTADSSFRIFNVVNDTVVNGSLRFIMQKNENPAFIKFVKEVNPSRFPSGRTFTTWWDELCENRCPFNPRNRNCTGVESGRQIIWSHCNLKFTGMSYIVYNSVYAVAYALHEMYQETPLSERLQDINKLKFQDLKGWKASPERQIIIKKEAIVWENKFAKLLMPRSVCSEKCLPGYRKSVREGQPVCCYDCLPCLEGQFSNQTDVDVCIKCPEDQWPNVQKTECIKKALTFLSYEDPIGIVLACIAILFSLIASVVLGTFIKYQNTPIVKANNRDLSYLILVSLMLSCLCCLIFIEKPEQLTCFSRQAIFGITFSISVSSLLGKTFIVVIAFNAAKPGNNLRKWVGAKVPKCIVFFCSVIQVFICILWILLVPPSTSYNTQSEIAKIILECDKGSAIAFYVILGYLSILASVCFAVAFLARKLPDTFNDAKLITFSMLVFFTVWIFFIPTYLSAKGTSTVAVEVFAILASSSGMLGSIFVPKCYIILIKPQKNRKNFVLKGSL
ncbi:vomeronasal type-2 receptor 26-like [Rana temporaria]|uniref:vomeronasal type-2 receptor 26-like n=1 Tax=Rana temporaria TaxID=8407 RepID=UPI001AACCE49|nr:vomeronasal type-2 receptor 26-like [Rana temporaria]